MIEKRKKLLVDRPLQGKLLLVSLLNGLFICVLFSLGVWVLSVQASKSFANSEGIDINCLARELEQFRNLGIVAIVSIFLSSIWTVAYSLFFSNKIAGPIYQIKTKLEDHLAGRSSNKISLRKNDYFKDLADLVNEVIDKK